MKRLIVRYSFFILRVLLVSLVFTACSFKRPAEESPAPTLKAFSKDFFSSDKKFACGWASEMETGYVAEALSVHNLNSAYGCNIKWTISERFLRGHLVDPSYINEPDKWPVAVTIPISAHYYEERSRDARGRETNVTIRNTSRSHWSARPNMSLNLEGIRFEKWAFASVYDSYRVLSVDDIDFDKQEGFLGFTVHVSGARFGSENQARFRINFLEFETNSNFERRYYHTENSRYINPVFKLSQKTEENETLYYVSHWDLSKQHTVYLYGFPEEYKSIGYEIVDDWNRALTEAHSPGSEHTHEYFKVSDETPERSFDLRRSTITFVDDKRISSRGGSPLGVAMVNPDVTNGEIIWGQVTVFGGMIDHMVTAYTPTSLLSQLSMDGSEGLSREIQLNPFSYQIPDAVSLPPAFSDGSHSRGDRAQLVEYLRGSSSFSMNSFTSILSYAEELAANEGNADLFAQLQGQEQEFSRDNLVEQSAQSILSELDLVSQNLVGENQDYWSRNRLIDILDFPQIDPSSVDYRRMFSGISEEEFSNLSQDDQTQFLLEKAQNQYAHFSNIPIQDLSRTFDKVALDWRYQIFKSGKTPGGVAKTLIKGVLIHEMGHFLGLGHNFKANLLPKEGTLPSAVFNELKDKASEEAGYTNITTVMGYSNGKTEVMFTPEDLQPGPYDVQMLAYLYHNKYPKYNSQTDQWDYIELDSTARIPPDHGFLPQCNDMDASWGPDPLCRRWDIGSDAMSIVRNYASNLTDNLVPTLISFSNTRGGNPRRAEAYLWHNSLRNLGAIRLFYDDMRWKYRDSAFKEISKNKDYLLNFSKACHDEQVPGHVQNFYDNLFAMEENQGLKEACQVNALAIRTYRDLVTLQGKDYTEMDYDDRYITYAFGGDWDVSRAEGTWRTLSVRPLKDVSLINLTGQTPYITYRGMLVPLSQYHSAQTLFTYNTLYPYEFTETIKDAVIENLDFASNGEDEYTMIGQSVLSLGYFLSNMRWGNDSLRVPNEYQEILRDQTVFRFNPSYDFVAIRLAKQENDDDENRVKQFTATLYNFRTGGETSIPEVYLLPSGKILPRAPEGMILSPISDFKWESDSSGFVIAYKLEFEDDPNDPLASHGLRQSLAKKYNVVFNHCVDGPSGTRNGLSTFFVNSSAGESEFEGFLAPPGIALLREHQTTFFRSIQAEYAKYYESERYASAPPHPETCEEAVKGLSMLFSTATVINGWWLPQVFDHFLKR